MRKEHRKLLSNLQKIGSPALVSELREGFRVNDRTLRRWLLMLCDKGKVEATGTNKGRRYQLAVPQEAEPHIQDGTLDTLQQELLLEAIHDAAYGRTLTILLAERVRAVLPAPARKGFASAVLQRLQTMTAQEAESLGISPIVFKYWHRLQSSIENPTNMPPVDSLLP